MVLDVTTDINIRQTAIQNKFNAIQTTSTFAPQLSFLQNMAYNPQMILNSPNSALGGGLEQTPTISPSVIVTPAIDQGAGGYEEAKQGGIQSSGMMDIIIIAVIGIVALIGLGALLKKKGKVKKGVTGIEVESK